MGDSALLQYIAKKKIVLAWGFHFFS